MSDILSVLRCRRMRGNPDVPRAINLVDYSMSSSHGDRDYAPNYLVLITRDVGGQRTIEAINKLKAKGTKVIGIGRLMLYYILLIQKLTTYFVCFFFF